jgi:hypothetical protein
MNLKHSLAFFQVLLVLMLAGCSMSGDGVDLRSSKEYGVTCEVFYRPAAGQALSPAPVIMFKSGSDHKYLVFDDMTFNARFQDDQYEGRALFLNVTGVHQSEEFSRQMYQFDGQNPPENQFIGGHGFTGLIYVFNPKTSSEMQYFCNIE